MTEQEEEKERMRRKKKAPKPAFLTSKGRQWLLTGLATPYVCVCVCGVTSHTGHVLMESREEGDLL